MVIHRMARAWQERGSSNWAPCGPMPTNPEVTQDPTGTADTLDAREEAAYDATLGASLQVRTRGDARRDLMSSRSSKWTSWAL